MADADPKIARKAATDTVVISPHFIQMLQQKNVMSSKYVNY